MINLLIGPPGGGKSYEAVAYHIIPALTSGRKVITNLSLNLENLPPEWRDLVEIRQESRAQGARAFSVVADYEDSWRHPGNGTGALVVLDECHLALPRGATSREVEEWYSLHRHKFMDVLLITQSYGKVSKPIIDLIQVLYRVRKATAFGLAKKYVRKVFDGVRGDCVNTSTRSYDSKFYKYYRSHTLASGPGQETGANDIVPIWKRWPFVLSILVFPLLVFMWFKALSGPGMFATKPHHAVVYGQAPAKVSSLVASAVQPVVLRSASAPASVVASAPIPPKHPFDGMGIHVVVAVQSAHRVLYELAISQNGIPVNMLSSDQFRQIGYKVTPLSDCVVQLQYKDLAPFFARCDLPKQGVNAPSIS